MGAEGVQWVTNNSSPLLTRWHGAAGSNVAYTPSTQAQATIYFDSISPWGYMGRMSVRPNGSVAARCDVGTTPLQSGDACYSDIDTENDHQKMVYVEQFCWYVDTSLANNVFYWIGHVGDKFRLANNSANYTFSVSDIHPMFISNGVARPYIFVGAFEGYYNAAAGLLESRAGVSAVADTQPTASLNITTARGHAEAHGDGWGLMTYQAWCGIALCVLIEYATFNVNSAISQGIWNITQNASNNCSCNVGHAASLGNATGQVAFTSEGNGGAAEVATQAVNIRGIENLYGNLFQYVDGINIRTSSDYKVFIADHDFSTDPTYAFSAPYANTGIVHQAQGFVQAFGYSVAAYKWMFIGVTAGGSFITYTCTYVENWAGSNGLAMGGDYGQAGAGTGLFTEKTFELAEADYNFGSRIQFTPPAAVA